MISCNTVALPHADVDECATGLAVCPRFRKCINTFGSYICKCHEGFDLQYINGKYQCIGTSTQTLHEWLKHTLNCFIWLASNPIIQSILKKTVQSCQHCNINSVAVLTALLPGNIQENHLNWTVKIPYSLPTSDSQV